MVSSVLGFSNLNKVRKETHFKTIKRTPMPVIPILASKCIPSKKVAIKPREPAWISFIVKRHIRKRGKAYRKAKRTNFKKLLQVPIFFKCSVPSLDLYNRIHTG